MLAVVVMKSGKFTLVLTAKEEMNATLSGRYPMSGWVNERASEQVNTHI